jgi:prepilin-type N-terminal cleavage/methylation domain-containing protein
MNTKDKSQGFTLIELSVVVLITGLIVAVSLTNYRQAERRKRVSLAADTVISALTMAQNYTLTGKKTNNSDPNCRKPVEYFVTFKYAEPTNIKVEATNNCGTVDTLETFKFPEQIQIQRLILTPPGAPASLSLAIYFTTPFGKITAKSDSNSRISFTTAQVILESTQDSSTTKTVNINGVEGRFDR